MRQPPFQWLFFCLSLALSASAFTTTMTRRPCRVGATVTALHQTKTITCRTDLDKVFDVLFEDEKSFIKFCEEYEVSFLVDNKGRRVYSFDNDGRPIYAFDYSSLVDMATYSISRKQPAATVSESPSLVDPSREYNKGSTRRETSRWGRILSFVHRARRYIFKRRSKNAILLPQQPVRSLITDRVPPENCVRPDEGFRAEQESLKKQFNYTTLLPPEQVQPLIPDRIQPEKYVCPSNFRESLLETVYERMEQEDSGSRVPPMALVGCSRSGKTRTLEEIAASLARNGTYPAVVLLVTFNDYSTSPITGEDQEDPLQALCQRIAFAATRIADHSSSSSLKTAYKLFRRQNYHIDPNRIEDWLAGSRAILLVDELNFLKGLTSKTPQAYEFGDFIRSNFLSDAGRYFIFTSHVLGTVDSFGAVIDTSAASSRGMDVQTLPRVDNFRDILHLNPSIDTPLKAIYYGLLPGLIYDQHMFKGPNAKMIDAVMIFNELTVKDKETWMINILKSLFTGDIDLVPPQLRILLTTRRVEHAAKSDNAKISWVPYILGYVLCRTTLTEGSWHADATRSLAMLCSELPSIRGGSGKGYEYLFAIAALARSIARLPDGVLLPEEWFENPAVEVVLNPFKAGAAGKALNDCKTWADLQKGFHVKRAQPTVAIFLPGHAFFRSYDVIAAYFEGGVLVDCRAFQLKEGRHNQPRPPKADAVPLRFLVKSQAPATGLVDNNGWFVPSANAIDEFFGESGRWWTPAQWARLKATFVKDDDDYSMRV